MAEIKYRYLVAQSESTEAEDLEALLNEKAADGYELFMLHEVDSRSGRLQYNCIFYKVEEETSQEDGESVEITDITDFKGQIEKIFHSSDVHKQYKELQQNILNTQKQIREIKNLLESASSEESQQELNESIKEKLEYLNYLKAQTASVTNSYNLYDRIKSDKLTVYLSEELINLTDNSIEDSLIARVIRLRQDLTDRLGFVIPNVKYSDSMELKPYQYRIDIREVPVATGFVYPSYRMFYKDQAVDIKDSENVIEAVDPVHLLDVIWIPEETCRTYWDKGSSASDILAGHLSYTCIKFVDLLLDYKDMNKFVDIAKKENSELVENLLPDIISMSDLRFLLVNLLKEMVSVKDIIFILEKVMDSYNIASDKETLLEKLRLSLGRMITHSKADENNVVYLISLDETLEELLVEKLVDDEETPIYLDLTKDEVAKLMNATAVLIEKSGVRIENTVVLVSELLRRALFNVYEGFIPGLSVMTDEELSDGIEIDEIGTLQLKSVTRVKRKNKED